MNTKSANFTFRSISNILLIILVMLLFGQGVNAEPKKYKLGDIPLSPEVYQKYLKKIPRDMATIEAALPSAYDARLDGDIVTVAKDQGQCGSCWAFACVGALESHLLKANMTGPEELSEQQQVSCNTAMWGCDGGSSSAIRYWENKGPLYETYFPYTTSDQTPCIEEEQLGYRIVDYHTVVQNTASFKDSLYTYGPSYWRFNVYSDFYTYWNYGSFDTVYVNNAYSLEGGHAVLLIGWDDAKNAFLCKNSWGATDGPNGDGTFWIAYNGHANNLGFGMTNFSLTSLTCGTDADCDDGLYCNGLETCVDGVCQDGTPIVCDDDEIFCNGVEFCDEALNDCSNTGNPCGDGYTCDNIYGICKPDTCGNGICNEGEDCNNCNVDCISGSGGGDCESCFKDKCDGSCHPVQEGPECSDCAPPYCCGDGVCNGEETSDNCAIDCGDSPAPDCKAKKEICSSNDECCSGKCAGGKCRQGMIGAAS